MLAKQKEPMGVEASAEDTPIIDLVNKGDLANLKKEIEEMEQEALTQVSAEGARDIVVQMLDERDSIGQTPLHHVNHGKIEDIEVARYLLSKGAKVNALDNRGNDPMLTAIENLGNLRAIQIVMTDKLSKGLKEKDDARHTLVAPALRSGFIESVGVTIALMDLFIAAGADYNLRNKKGSYAFPYLCGAAQVEEIQEARSSIANINSPSFDKAFQEYLKPSLAAAVQQGSNSHSNGKKKGNCIVM